jgi:nitroreductase
VPELRRGAGAATPAGGVVSEGDGFFDVVHRQRACRWFTDDEVPDADLTRMLEAAVRAPSAENAQPWVFVVVRDAAQRARVADLAREIWRAGGRDHAAVHTDDRTFADVDASVEAGFGGAPVLVVVAGDTTAVHRRALGSSLFPAVQNLLLAAIALGYGSALTTLATIPVDGLRAALDLPEHLEPVAVVPIGRPARRLGSSRRDPVAGKVHVDRFTPAPDR